MSAPLKSEPSPATSGEVATAGPAGLGPGERDVVAGRYRLLEHIAEGGMGVVYRAEHVLSRKKLALKVVHPYLCKGRQGVERFRREVSAAAEIDHPGIVQVYDAGVDDDGGFFMAMELLEGESLGDLLRREWPGMARAVRLVEGMLEPLAKAHAKGFVHRDLKPDNVFLTKEEDGRERVKILDFGLAREVTKGGPTRTGITFGTPEYMSPEQAMSARKVRAPGDVWSVGVMLYELLSGTHPFSGETPNAIMANAIKEPLPPLASAAPHVPAELARLIERSLEKKPEDRPQDAGQMLEELRALLARVALDDTVPSAPVAPPKWTGEEEDEDDSYPLAPAQSVEIAIAQPTYVPAASAPARRSSRAVPIAIAAALLLVVGVGASAGVYLMMAAEPPEMAVTELDRPSEPAPVAPELVEPEPAQAAPSEPAPEAAVEPSAPAPPEPPSAPSQHAAPAAQARPAVRAPRPSAEVEPVEEQGPSALEEARDCFNRGDRQCSRRILEARARTAAEHALLIDTYRELGLMGPMLDRMQAFVRRYPRASQTPEYRELLRRYGR